MQPRHATTVTDATCRVCVCACGDVALSDGFMYARLSVHSVCHFMSGWACALAEDKDIS